MLYKRVNRWLSVAALLLASVETCARAAIYELPADGAVALGTDLRVKLTEQDTLLEIGRRATAFVSP
jgi:hypothetical protein